jgi:hypothetical protein
LFELVGLDPAHVGRYPHEPTSRCRRSMSPCRPRSSTC